MLILSDARCVRAWTAAYHAAHLRIGFVPTMGALHEGHLSLLRAARAECERVVASIFVNPLQFGPGEDADRYPRPFAQDRALCEAAGVDLLYHGRCDDFYPPEFRTSVRVRELTEGLCGRGRPTHFDGVTTVVAKLLLRVLPHTAYFGQKDYQQAAVITRMTADLDIPTRIQIMPTVREADGLAMSSRNLYLTADQRRAAPCLWRGLCAASAAWERGERRAGPLKNACSAVIRGEPLATLEYVEIADGRTLRALGDDATVPEGAVLATAARIGAARLIDNTLLGP